MPVAYGRPAHKLLSNYLLDKRAGANSSWYAVTVSSGNSYTQYALYRHGMAAITPIVEKSTCALPFAIIECGSMDIVLAVKLDFKARKLDALWLISVALGFRNFVDHT
jgi:hypothetical protein